MKTIKDSETLKHQLDMNFTIGCTFSMGGKLYKYVDKVVETINNSFYDSKTIVVALELTVKGGYVALDCSKHNDKKVVVIE